MHDIRLGCFGTFIAVGVWPLDEDVALSSYSDLIEIKMLALVYFDIGRDYAMLHVMTS